MTKIYCHGFLFVVFLIVDILHNCDAIKCFECVGIPYPRDCARITTCGPHEYCHVEQYVTSDGTLLYNTGCEDNLRCSSVAGGTALVGRSVVNMLEKRSTDVTTCVECCQTSYCNNQGCGATEVPRIQRGPYCYTCHSTTDPNKCNQVSVCPRHEVCLLMVPIELSGLPETLYRGQCQSKTSCDVIATANRNNNCPVHCCEDDFCNDQCGKFSNNTMETPKPGTTRVPITTAAPAPTKPPQPTTTTVAKTTTTTPPPNHASVPQCKSHHYYDDITGMCIRLFEGATKTFTQAKQACAAIGDRLAEPDSHEKTVFIENTLLHHSNIGKSDDRSYWIGAFDKYNRTQFYWSNGHKITYTNWGGGDDVVNNQQPDDIKEKNQDCVVIYGPDRYRWADDHCWSTWHYICEDPLTLKHASSSNNNCRDGHYYDEVTGMCIQLGELIKMNYREAERACHNLGDTLVTIDSHEKTIFVENILLHHSTVNDVTDRKYYIGLKDQDHHEHFVWPGNRHLQYTNWGGGDEVASNQQPDGHGDDCVMLYGRDHYQWHDVTCNEDCYYICEYTKTLKHN